MIQAGAEMVAMREWRCWPTLEGSSGLSSKQGEWTQPG
jgi:hypothetical protein